MGLVVTVAAAVEDLPRFDAGALVSEWGLAPLPLVVTVWATGLYVLGVLALRRPEQHPDDEHIDLVGDGDGEVLPGPVGDGPVGSDHLGSNPFIDPAAEDVHARRLGLLDHQKRARLVRHGRKVECRNADRTRP